MLPLEIDYPDARHVSVKPEPLDDPIMVKQEVLTTSVPSLPTRRKQHLRIWLHSLTFPKPRPPREPSLTVTFHGTEYGTTSKCSEPRTLS